jgi:hypothetical protein
MSVSFPSVFGVVPSEQQEIVNNSTNQNNNSISTVANRSLNVNPQPLSSNCPPSHLNLSACIHLTEAALNVPKILTNQLTVLPSEIRSLTQLQEPELYKISG